ncbi:MAG: CRTAC1 family protein [Bryobacterales bacterium]|nr:CRTAC1 family protein [Bryobacterales bacterium]
MDQERVGRDGRARASLAFLLALAGATLGSPRSGSASDPAPIRFRDVAPESGIPFVLHNAPTPEKRMIETMAGGVAAFDYNGDGLADIYFTNGARIPSLKKESPEFWNRLYRNDGDMRFTDVTEEAGVSGHGYDMGAAAADYDNDGDVDLLVAGVFRLTLFRNLGDGTFEDATETAGLDARDWSVAAGWFDYDNDGLLDLFVVNYARWSLEFDTFCGDAERGLRAYCDPMQLTPIANRLYRNLGRGRFVEVSEGTGVSDHPGRGMSVAFADADGDGLIDALVTNDNLPNFLFLNRAGGEFEEAGMFSGTALLQHGDPVASMGVDFRDYDNDGLPDVAVTALIAETFPLFRNTGDGFFEDATGPSGMAANSNRRSGWSNGLYDFNNDGFKDLFTANSHVNDIIGEFEDTTPYREPNSVFANRGDGTFQDHSSDAGAGFAGTAQVHRGCAFADFNRDGRVDVVVTSLGGPAELWENISPGDRGWLNIRLSGSRSNRDGIGAVVRIGGQINSMTSAVGYASSSHDGVHFGLGDSVHAVDVAVHWPSGVVQILEDISARQVLDVSEPFQ